MFRKNPRRPGATPSPELRDMELKDDELEHVVGGPAATLDRRGHGRSTNAGSDSRRSHPLHLDPAVSRSESSSARAIPR